MARDGWLLLLGPFVLSVEFAACGLNPQPEPPIETGGGGGFGGSAGTGIGDDGRRVEA